MPEKSLSPVKAKKWSNQNLTLDKQKTGTFGQNVSIKL